MNYTVALRDLIKDPAVVTELDRIAAVSKALETSIQALGGTITRDSAEKGLDTGDTIKTLATDDAGNSPSGIRWMRGPWLIGADGPQPGVARIIPARITTNVNDYAPTGIDTAIVLELTLDADHTMTGLRAAANQARFLCLLNRSGFALTLTVNDTASQAGNRFEFGFSGDTLILRQGFFVWLYYETQVQRWHLLAMPAVSSSDLPSALQTSVASFPPDYGWFGSRCHNGVAPKGIGEPDPTFGGTGSFANDTVGVGRALATAAAAGSQAGVISGGSSQVSPQHDPTWEVVVKTGASVADIRIWIVLTQSNPTDSDNFANQRIGFRYSTVAADPGWVGITRDSGGTQNVTGIVAAITTNTVYKLKVRKSGSTVYFSVNGGTEVSTTANMPDATAEFFWALQWFTQAASAKTLTWYWQWVKYGISA